MSLYLVTGGAGFIGSHLVRALLGDGHPVRVLDNLEPPSHDGSHPVGLDARAEFLRGDVRDPRDLARALDGVTTVLHLAATGGFTGRIADYFDHNTLGTARLLEVIRDRKVPVRRMLVASSVAIYGEGTGRCAEHGRIRPRPRPLERLARGEYEPTCPACGSQVTPELTAEDDAPQPERPYSISKYDQERLVLSIAPELDIDAAALRYFLTYGPGQSTRNPYTGVISIFATLVRRGLPPVVYEDGAQTRDLIYVQDLVDAHRVLLAEPSLGGRVFNVGTGQPTTVHDVAATVLAALPYGPGETAPRLDRPGRYRLGDVRHVIADPRRLQALGWKPKVGLPEGVARYVDWFAATAGDGESFTAAERGLVTAGLVRGAAHG